LQANNDIDAFSAYLTRFIDQPHTFRAYRKELERFILWSVLIQKKSVSDLLVTDCEAYKSFLKAPCPSFVGVKTERTSNRWRPFSEASLSTKSQNKQLSLFAHALITW